VAEAAALMPALPGQKHHGFETPIFRTPRNSLKILSWNNVRELFSKCGTKKKGETHVCPANGSTCKKCKRTGHFDPHCFGNWKTPTESRQVTGEADYASLQVDMPTEYQYSDSESDATSYAMAMSRRN
jgi:hypothetical protein